MIQTEVKISVKKCVNIIHLPVLCFNIRVLHSCIRIANKCSVYGFNVKDFMLDIINFLNKEVGSNDFILTFYSDSSIDNLKKLLFIN